MYRTHRAPAVLALALSLGLSLGLASCAEDDPASDDPTAVDSPTATDEPTDDPSETTSATATPNDGVAASVYFVGNTPIGDRLYREFRNVEADNPLEEAAALMTAGDALDPDYRTAFPGGGFDSVEYNGEFFEVRVADDSWNTPAPGMTKRDAKLATQQLVYTLQGVQQETAPVKVFIGDSSTPSPLFGFDTTDGLTAAKPLTVLAFMSVTTPEEGATVGDVFTATGVGSSFEATVQWEVRDPTSGSTVREGFTTADGWIDRLYPWEAEVDVSALTPGTYVFAALTDDPSDGEGAGPTEDTKTIIIE